MVAWLERHQVPLYLATMVLGAALGLAFPAVTSTWEPAVPPLIAVLLWSTFLGIPLTQLGDGLRDRRFLLVLLGLNFLVVPVVAWLLTRPLTGHPELVLGSWWCCWCRASTGSSCSPGWPVVTAPASPPRPRC